MEISQLGEFGLIDRLTQDLENVNASTLKGVGDDCAVIRNHDTDILVTTDLLLEGVHFDLTYVPLKHLGYKSAIVNFSDVYAMNGTPRQITVSLGISKRFTVEHIEELFAGIRLACRIYGRRPRRWRHHLFASGTRHLDHLYRRSSGRQNSQPLRSQRHRPDLRLRRSRSRLHGPPAP